MGSRHNLGNIDEGFVFLEMLCTNHGWKEILAKHQKDTAITNTSAG